MKEPCGISSRKGNSSVLILLESEKVIGVLKDIGCDPRLEFSKLAFEENITGVLNLAHIPFTLARASVWRQRFTSLFAAEKIRSLNKVELGGDLTDELVREAEISAIARLSQEWLEPEKRNDFSGLIVKELLSAAEDKDYESGISELLRQLCIMVWTAFEVLASDVIRLTLNERPHLVMRLAESKEFKNHFSGGALLDGLSNLDFDMSKSIGDYFVSQVNLDSLPKIRSVISRIFDDGAMDQGLKNPQIYNLNAKRNLIVHRRGVIDEKYKAATSSSQAVGEKLVLDANMISSDLELVISLANTLLDVSSQRLCDST
ncbi:hypothetical protein [Thioclava sp. DLFJ4-1]|uniref:hypothetical protein n=1 Tax=Thioclava sp. DLFJ4-1 TaxID=1915313 RepID=UPI00117C50FA|nr:hypothetical protein [Thioclava sp. DLFJ4-1]